MLRRIPTIRAKGMESFFASIDSRLTLYESLEDSPALLELVLWKSKITKRFSQSNTLPTTEMKMQCRADSIRMVNIVVPNVMTFLTDGDDHDCVIDNLSENEGEENEANDEDNNFSDEDDDNEDNDDPDDEVDFDAVNDDDLSEEESDNEIDIDSMRGDDNWSDDDDKFL